MIGLVPVITSVFSASKGRPFERVSKNETGYYTCQEYFNEDNEILTPFYDPSFKGSFFESRLIRGLREVFLARVISTWRRIFTSDCRVFRAE